MEIWQYNYGPMRSDELYHHGIKGMKWGVRRFQNEDGTLTPSGIKRYAKKGYAQDAYEANKSLSGKIYDKFTGAHKIAGKIEYDLSTEKQNKKRAYDYVNGVKPVEKEKNDPQKDKLKSIRDADRLGLGSKMASSLLNQIGHNEYAKYRNNASSLNIAVVNGSAYASMALDLIGDIALSSAMSQRMEYVRENLR